jgi:hypothetical protein
MPSHVLAGSTVTKVYFVVRSYWGVPEQIGDNRTDFQDAVDAAADHWHDRKRVFAEAALVELPPLPVAEERWQIALPDGSDGTLDIMIDRIRFTPGQLISSRERRSLDSEYPASSDKEN